MMNLTELQSIAPQGIWDDVTSRAVHGEQLTFAIIELTAGAHVREHRHDNEQIGVLVQGSMTFRVGDETKELRPGGTWRILSGVPHEAHAGPDGAVAVEAFSPPRSDWQEHEALPPSAPRWPG